ncbi:jg1402 [Pararge aegeria aegeria]|uniref:Jg1402 protein n=1 Tax=Pararge aegeria aegeria TaxID=348720 RepID=A0A8S4RK29_9NEOP|nr:jg1402 [Pararge aegeria aegeria]
MMMIRVVENTDRLENLDESLEKKEGRAWCGEPPSPYAPPALPPRDRVCCERIIIISTHLPARVSSRNEKGLRPPRWPSADWWTQHTFENILRHVKECEECKHHRQATMRTLWILAHWAATLLSESKAVGSIPTTGKQWKVDLEGTFLGKTSGLLLEKSRRALAELPVAPEPTVPPVDSVEFRLEQNMLRFKNMFGLT